MGPIIAPDSPPGQADGAWRGGGVFLLSHERADAQTCMQHSHMTTFTVVQERFSRPVFPIDLGEAREEEGSRGPVRSARPVHTMPLAPPGVAPISHPPTHACRRKLFGPAH